MSQTKTTKVSAKPAITIAKKQLKQIATPVVAKPPAVADSIVTRVKTPMKTPNMGNGSHLKALQSRYASKGRGQHGIGRASISHNGRCYVVDGRELIGHIDLSTNTAAGTYVAYFRANPCEAGPRSSSIAKNFGKYIYKKARHSYTTSMAQVSGGANGEFVMSVNPDSNATEPAANFEGVIEIAERDNNVFFPTFANASMDVDLSLLSQDPLFVQPSTPNDEPRLFEQYKMTTVVAADIAPSGTANGYGLLFFDYTMELTEPTFDDSYEENPNGGFTAYVSNLASGSTTAFAPRNVVPGATAQFGAFSGNTAFFALDASGRLCFQPGTYIVEFDFLCNTPAATISTAASITVVGSTCVAGGRTVSGGSVIAYNTFDGVAFATQSTQTVGTRLVCNGTTSLVGLPDLGVVTFTAPTCSAGDMTAIMKVYKYDAADVENMPSGPLSLPTPFTMRTKLDLLDSRASSTPLKDDPTMLLEFTRFCVSASSFADVERAVALNECFDLGLNIRTNVTSTNVAPAVVAVAGAIGLWLVEHFGKRVADWALKQAEEKLKKWAAKK